ncbi:MAG: PBP1A family penicillin-binding protein [Nitrospirae bacterium]|nr:MAG: PBP1A family penicillin-binding protein [Nitrospirota bacterium]
MLSFHIIKRLAFIGLIIFTGIAIGGTMALAWYAATGLPSLEKLHEYQPSLITRVYADNGQVIGQFYVERRIFTPLAEVPEHLIQAVIAVEDRRFFEHPGLDIWGILRAAWTNLKHGGTVEGASTITQQLARSLFLSPERTFQRKFRELLLAIKMELVLNKEQILEMYLNQIYFGHGAYGIGTASLTYFDKGLAELNLPEAAFLAGLPKAPNTYSPYKNPDLAKRRQEHVLRRMVQAGFITPDQAKEAAATPLVFKRQSFEPIAPYFLEHVRQHLLNEYGETMVYKGGLQVFTTLNVAMQKSAEQALRHGLRALDKRQGWRGPLGQESLPVEIAESLPPTLPDPEQILRGVVIRVTKNEAIVVAEGIKAPLALKDMLWARRRLPPNAPVTEAQVFPHATVRDLLSPGDVIEVRLQRDAHGSLRFVLDQTPVVEGALLAIDPRTGAIRAMVGGYDYQRSQFNRALLARRQPGSAFKPMIYATALMKGFTPATLVMDAPVVYEEEESGKIWKPENYEKRFYGPITLREALRHSRNAATVRLLEQIGVWNVIQLSRNLGITSPLSPDLSLALGSSGITLAEITSAYGIFANQGMALTPYTISIVKDQEGHILEQHLFEPRQVVPKEIAYLITHMLMDVIQSGTGRQARSIGRPLAGKTGTTNSYHDAWFVGYAPNLVAGVWVGFDDMQPLGKVESGAHAALPIWKEFMATALAQLPVQTFAIPEGIEFAEIDPTTGTLARHPTPSTTTEVFTKDTVPLPTSTQSPLDPLEFYEFDQPAEAEPSPMTFPAEKPGTAGPFHTP